MISNSFVSAGSREVHLAIHTQKLERAYQDSLRRASATQEVEERRRLRLRIALLETDNDDLRDRVEQRDCAVEVLQGERDDLTEQLHAVTQSCEAARDEVRVKTRQIDNLQTERDGLRGQSTDSSKMLKEKMALSRELSVLKPEVEHLRSQLATNQNAVSEKLSLQRQLRATEVELENEKRAAHKTQAQDGERYSDGDARNAQDLQKELKKEREERQLIQTEARKAVEEIERRNAILESRLETFRAKLVKTKEELVAARTTSEGTNTVHESKPHPKKRNFAQVDPDAAIGTPGHPLPNKRGKRENSTQPGEKSSFSITPFLNKTGSVAPESPASSPSKPPAAARPSEVTTTVKIPVPESPELIAKQFGPRPKSSGASIASRGNAGPAPKRTAARSLSASKLDQVLEEGEDNADAEGQRKSEGAVSSRPVQLSRASEQPFAKKRKFLGKTIFDDDDGPARIKPVGMLSGKPSIASFSRAPGSKPLRFGSSPSKPVVAFGTFSPLKKQRKLTAI